jgi:hypothetical protein
MTIGCTALGRGRLILFSLKGCAFLYLFIHKIRLYLPDARHAGPTRIPSSRSSVRRFVGS